MNAVDTPPIVVGIVNVTPDSFYDGGRYPDLVRHALQLVEEGADWLDIGGESTRPGADAITAEEECARVLPLITALANTVPISIDTTKPLVAKRALQKGASIINDVSGLCNPQMVALTQDAWGTVVMHNRGTPQTMGSMTQYPDLVSNVRDHLVEAPQRAKSPNVCIDPGIGFAKTADQSVTLIRHLNAFVQTGFPVFLGASRKSFIGQTLNLPDPDARLYGSLAAVAAAHARGVRVFRVHDVAPTKQLLGLLQAIDSPPAPYI